MFECYVEIVSSSGRHRPILFTISGAASDQNFIKMTPVLVQWCFRHCSPFVILMLQQNGALTRYAKLRVAHASGIPGTFSPPLTSKETASQRSRHASRHVRDVTHVPWCMSGSQTRGGEENAPGIPSASTNRNISYLVRGPWWTFCNGGHFVDGL